MDIPRDVRGRGQDYAAKHGRALSFRERARSRVPIEELSHADQVGAKPVDPGSLTITSQPRELTTDIAEKIGMAPDATSHPGALARALRASEAVASCFVEDRVELRVGHPTRVTGLDLFPGGPGLSPLPLIGRRQFGGILQLSHVLVEEHTRRRGELQAAASRLPLQPPSQRGGDLHAQRAEAFWSGSGFHYHALYHRRGLRAVTT